jgi:hypothetical protein
MIRNNIFFLKPISLMLDGMALPEVILVRAAPIIML